MTDDQGEVWTAPLGDESESALFGEGSEKDLWESQGLQGSPCCQLGRQCPSEDVCEGEGPLTTMHTETYRRSRMRHTLQRSLILQIRQDMSQKAPQHP